MKVIEQSVHWFQPPPDNALEIIELAARNCYKSEDKIGPGSAEKMVKMLLASQHESVIEHVSASLRLITDRSVSHELVRHRLASYSQESQRYCNYGKDKFGDEITVIMPVYFLPDSLAYRRWYNAMHAAENAYFELLDMCNSPQEARSVLPNSTKTEIIMTTNLREWRHIFVQRCSPQAHPQIRALMTTALGMFQEAVPIIFADIEAY